MSIRIAVIGGNTADETTSETAYQVGREIAKKDAVLVCGGLYGVMEEASRGARDVGGTTVGILPGSDINQANPFIDIPIATGFGYARNFLVVSNCDAVIALKGAYGTLSEIAMALNIRKPVIGLGSWEIEGMHIADNPCAAVDMAIHFAEG